LVTAGAQDGGATQGSFRKLMAKALAQAPHRRFSLSSAALPPLLLWALFCVALGSGVAAYLLRASVAATENIYARAEAVAAMAEHTLLRSFEAIQGVHDLLQLRQSLLEADEAPGAHAIQMHIRGLAAGGRFGILQISVTDRNGLVVWDTDPGAVGAPAADREHVRAHLDGASTGVLVSRPLPGGPGGRWGLHVSRPVRDLWGRVVGVGVVSLDPLALSRGLGRDVNGASQVAIVRRLSDGALLARSRGMESRFGEPGDSDHPSVAAARSAPAGRLAYRGVRSKREVIGAFRVPEGLPVVATAAFGLHEERAQFRRTAIAFAAAAAAAMLLGLQVALSWARGRRLRQSLQVEAARDPLTGLLNRRALQAQADRLFADARASGRPLALLLLDLDHFKSINDTHGHAAGDAVLRDVAEVLTREIRQDDLACRWGGEEMLAVLRNCDLARAEERAVALRRAIAAAERPGGVQGLRVTASIGVAAFPEHGAGLEELTKRADSALYVAKRYGRDCVVCADLAPA
jgi:diguanylate cyclase (GGDEF)-like protein